MSPHAFVRPLPVTEVVVLSEGEAPVIEGVWPDRVVTTTGRAELHVLRAASPRGRVLVLAGGGYTRLMLDKEGFEIAQWLCGLGYDAHVLIHRLPGQADGRGGVWPSDIALSDALLALDHLGQEGDAPVVLCGLSSGGHLAGVLTCQETSVRIAGAVIAYAPLNANHRHLRFPPERPDFMPREKQAFYDDWAIGIAGEEHGIPRTPLFLAYALHDAVVPLRHATNLLETARERGLSVEAHIFAEAPHGFALRALEGGQSQWPALAEAWIERVITSPAG